MVNNADTQQSGNLKMFLANPTQAINAYVGSQKKVNKQNDIAKVNIDI